MKLNLPRKHRLIAACLPLALGASACGSDETGTLSVVVEAEDVIQEGLSPDGDEPIEDGWSVTFDKYIVTIGDIDLERSTDHAVTAEAAEAYAVDLVSIPAAGEALWELADLEAGRWEFHYSILGAGDGATRHASVNQADFDEMEANDWTYLVDATQTKSDGASCPPMSLATPPSSATSTGMNAGGDACYENTTLHFTFGVQAETSFGPCEVDEVPGVSIPEGGTQTAALTIHGDHIYFNGFPTGDEGGIMRLAQWLADCDLDLDGEVTQAELEQIQPSDLPEIDTRYQLGGSPIEDLESQSMWVYLTAQLKTQGHLQGEGECAVDGEGHDH